LRAATATRISGDPVKTRSSFIKVLIRHGTNFIERHDSSSLKRGSSQGINVSPRVRTALDAHGMKLAISKFRRDGYEVDDVHERMPVDLICRRRSEVLRVVVKATQNWHASRSIVSSYRRDLSRSDARSDGQHKHERGDARRQHASSRRHVECPPYGTGFGSFWCLHFYDI
jgi:hypothetical protein